MENTNTNTNTNTNQMEVKSKKARKARKVRAAAAPKPRATALEFSPEPDKAGWRYADGRGGRFCIGASRHHGTAFGLYYKSPEMSRFKFLAKFEAFSDAQAEAEKVDAERK
jgi:hypothetical protein